MRSIAEHKTDFWLICEEPQSLGPSPTTCFPLFQSTGNAFCDLPLPPMQRESGRPPQAPQQRAAAATRIPSSAARLGERSVRWDAGRGCCHVQFTGQSWRAFMVSYHKNARPTRVVLPSNRARLLAFALSGQLINLRRAAASLL